MSRIADPRARFTLLRAAEEVFAERGLAGAKVEEITRRAGVSKGAFYLHFESKEAALEQVVETFLAGLARLFAPPAEYAEQLPEGAAELLDFGLERDVRVFEFLWKNRVVLRILPGCQGEHGHLVDAFRAGISCTAEQWVEHWKREELFRADVDGTLAATLISGAYNELVARMAACGDERPPLAHWLAFAQETFMRAFGTPALVRAVEARAQMRDGSRHGIIGERTSSLCPAKAGHARERRTRIPREDES